jgi:hypothetical protein
MQGRLEVTDFVNPARHSRKNNHEDATKAGMHCCRSLSARSSTAMLRHRVSSTRSHSPGPLPSLIHPVYWPVLGSQSLLNPRNHPRYLPPYPIDWTRPGPGGYRHVSRERAQLPRPPLHFPSLRPWRSSGFTPSRPSANRRAEFLVPNLWTKLSKEIRLGQN